MDIDALAKGVGIFGSALAAIKQAVDLLPKGSNKANVAAALEQAALEFKKAEAEAAQQLGYEICTNHWPPEIMVTLPGKKDYWQCPVCKDERNLGSSGIIRQPGIQQRNAWPPRSARR